MQAFGTLGYLAARELATFYTVAAIFGFIYAGVMPLYSVIARENFPLRMMGTVIGGMVTAGGLGMATGPVTGWPDLRFFRQLLRALRHVVLSRDRRVPDRADLQAVPEEPAGARAGVTGLAAGRDDDFVERLDRGRPADFDDADSAPRKDIPRSSTSALIPRIANATKALIIP